MCEHRAKCYTSAYYTSSELRADGTPLTKRQAICAKCDTLYEQSFAKVDLSARRPPLDPHSVLALHNERVAWRSTGGGRFPA